MAHVAARGRWELHHHLPIHVVGHSGIVRRKIVIVTSQVVHVLFWRILIVLSVLSVFIGKLQQTAIFLRILVRLMASRSAYRGHLPRSIQTDSSFCFCAAGILLALVSNAVHIEYFG